MTSTFNGLPIPYPLRFAAPVWDSVPQVAGVRLRPARRRQPAPESPAGASEDARRSPHIYEISGAGRPSSTDVLSEGAALNTASARAGSLERPASERCRRLEILPRRWLTRRNDFPVSNMTVIEFRQVAGQTQRIG